MDKSNSQLSIIIQDKLCTFVKYSKNKTNGRETFQPNPMFLTSVYKFGHNDYHNYSNLLIIVFLVSVLGKLRVASIKLPSVGRNVRGTRNMCKYRILVKKFLK